MSKGFYLANISEEDNENALKPDYEFESD